MNGAGKAWEFTGGYSYRLPEWTSGAGHQFEADEWYFGGVGSLEGPSPTLLLLTYTTPAAHDSHPDGCVESATEPSADLNCDGIVDVEDTSCLVQGLVGGQAGWRLHLDAAYPAEGRCLHERWRLRADLSGDGEVDAEDIGVFIEALIGG